ncbi:hypothetical protein AFIC_001918 [[Pseudomonas] carboxydohydrogena]|uniref:Cytochrome c domain-containing protein n=1 Tax=Afipia carboxydohydrogena TaxID=290 RepID=A0ABY8BLP2_AFICR|nr:hypothetical protein [[Pseudomonas] carboxydohydrogena]WEF50381.1 hypothetical protein AFIC_001918 [[Pseudomonas] carboxydohydrogena]
MSRRALSLAAAVLWMSAAGPAAAQNLEAGKTPAQIFAATCAVCHKSPHGLLKSVAPGSLPGFLRQHYTTSTDMAGAMSAYVLSNGAANRRAGDDLTREGRELTSPKPRERDAEPKERQERHIGAEKPVRGHAAKPKDEGAGEADAKGKKPKVDRRKPKNAPAKDEPKDTSRPAPDTAAQPKPEAPVAAPASPAEPAAQPESKPAAPAPEAPAKKPDEAKPASNMPVFNVEPKADTAPAAPAPDKPAETAPAGAPAAQ